MNKNTNPANLKLKKLNSNPDSNLYFKPPHHQNIKHKNQIHLSFSLVLLLVSLSFSSPCFSNPNPSSTSWSSIFDFYILYLGLAIHRRSLIYVSSLASPWFFSSDSLKGFDFRRFLLVRDFEDTYGQLEISLLWSSLVAFWCIPHQTDCGRFRVCEVFSLFKEPALLCLKDKGDSSIFAKICVIPWQLWQLEEKNNHCDMIFLVQTLSSDGGVVVGLPLSPLFSSLNFHPLFCFDF